jgi:hypothetical protein
MYVSSAAVLLFFLVFVDVVFMVASLHPPCDSVEETTESSEC